MLIFKPLLVLLFLRLLSPASDHWQLGLLLFAAFSPWLILNYDNTILCSPVKVFLRCWILQPVRSFEPSPIVRSLRVLGMPSPRPL